MQQAASAAQRMERAQQDQVRARLQQIVSANPARESRIVEAAGEAGLEIGRE